MLPDDVRDVIEVLESTIDRRSHMSEAVRGAIEGSVNALKAIQQALAERERENEDLRKQLERAQREPKHYVGSAWFVGDFVIEPQPDGKLKWRRQHKFQLAAMTGYATPDEEPSP